LISAIWKYVAAALAAGLITAGIIRGTQFRGSASDPITALLAIIFISMVFIAIYLGMVILFHQGLMPLRQVASLLRELASPRKDTRPAAEALER
jgi:hypothetical protein